MNELMHHNRVLRDPTSKYPGTLFEVRMLAFIWLILGNQHVEQERPCWQPITAEEILKVRRNPRDPNREMFVQGYDWVAITNAVKCSPRRSRGEPTFEMKTKCPNYILSREIEILKPGVILALGAWAGENREPWAKERRVISVPHPAWPGFSDEEEFKKLELQISRGNVCLSS